MFEKNQKNKKEARVGPFKRSSRNSNATKYLGKVVLNHDPMKRFLSVIGSAMSNFIGANPSVKSDFLKKSFQSKMIEKRTQSKKKSEKKR